MRITFVGSSHGVPEANRHCSCTMLEVGGNIYFVDMGTLGTEAIRDRRLHMDDVKGIFITHMHGDHTNGLPAFIDLSSWYFGGCNPTVILPREDAPDIIKSWVALNNVTVRDGIKFETAKEGVVFDDGIIKVTAFKTKHLEPSYSYMIEAEEKTVIFTGDLRGPTKDFPEFAKDRAVDLLICEAAHFEATAYGEVFKNECSEIKKVIVNHWADWNFGNILKLQEDMAPMVVEYASDGLIVNI